MRPTTLEEVAEWTLGGDSFDRCLANFLDEFYANPSAAAIAGTHPRLWRSGMDLWWHPQAASPVVRLFYGDATSGSPAGKPTSLSIPQPIRQRKRPLPRVYKPLPKRIRSHLRRIIIPTNTKWSQKTKARAIEALRWLLLLPGSWLAAVVIPYISAFIINRYTYDTAILLDYFVATIAASYWSLPAYTTLPHAAKSSPLLRSPPPPSSSAYSPPSSLPNYPATTKETALLITTNIAAVVVLISNINYGKGDQGLK